MVFNRLINLFHQHHFLAATAVKCYCKCNIMRTIIAVRFLSVFFFIQMLFFLILSGCEQFFTYSVFLSTKTNYLSVLSKSCLIYWKLMVIPWSKPFIFWSATPHCYVCLKGFFTLKKVLVMLPGPFNPRRSFTLVQPWIIYLYLSTFVRDEVTLPYIVTDYGSPAETSKGRSNPPPLLANGEASSRSLSSVSLSLWLTFH